MSNVPGDPTLSQLDLRRAPEQARGDQSGQADAGRLDLGERERLETERARLEGLLSSIVDSTSDLIWSVDAERFRLVTFNRALRDYFRRGWQIEVREGMEQDELLPPPSAERWRALYRRALREGPFSLEYETETEGLVLELHLSPLERGGRISGISVFGRDVTEKRRALVRLQEVREEEKARIARDLHDELGQLLTGLKLDLLWMEERLESMDSTPLVNALVDRAVAASALAERTVTEVQRLATDLRPAALDRLGLGAALRQEGRRFEARAQIACLVELSEPLRALPAATSTALYRIAQEALTNVARHARARQVVVRLEARPAELELTIEDDGVGVDLDGADVLRGLGLAGMRERASLVSGELTIGLRPGGGTRVCARLPLRAEGEEGR